MQRNQARLVGFDAYVSSILLRSTCCARMASSPKALFSTLLTSFGNSVSGDMWPHHRSYRNCMQYMIRLGTSIQTCRLTVKMQFRELVRHASVIMMLHLLYNASRQRLPCVHHHWGPHLLLPFAFWLVACWSCGWQHKLCMSIRKPDVLRPGLMLLCCVITNLEGQPVG